MRITLCGSSRFEQEFKDWAFTLSLKGHRVHGLSAYRSDLPEGGPDEAQKEILDLLHMAKIMDSDAILVIDKPGEGVENYIGFSTRRELAWAEAIGKHVYMASDFAHNPREFVETLRFYTDVVVDQAAGLQPHGTMHQDPPTGDVEPLVPQRPTAEEQEADA